MVTKKDKHPTKSAKAPPSNKSLKKSRTAKTAKMTVAPAAPVTPSASADSSDKKLSALDAAALVLAEGGEPINCQEMIAMMAAKGLWTSPGGKTPASTLYSAILKEIRTKGARSRFQKTARGKFART